jgi:hypothetical protein
VRLASACPRERRTRAAQGALGQGLRMGPGDGRGAWVGLGINVFGGFFVGSPLLLVLVPLVCSTPGTVSACVSFFD